MKRLTAFIGIDCQPEMAQGAGFQVPSYTVDQHRLVGNKPDAKRLDAWERALTPRQVEIFESITYELLQYLGYRPRFGIKARGSTLKEQLSTVAVEAIFNLKNSLRFSRRERHRWRPTPLMWGRSTRS